MNWAWRATCAVALAVAFGSGCETIGLGLPSFAEQPGPREHIVPGTPDKQVVVLEAALRERGLRPETVPGDNTTTIACNSISGQPFKIVLRRTLDGRTCARAVLDHPADDDMKSLLAQLDLR
jgi:hypothetical protein